MKSGGYVWKPLASTFSGRAHVTGKSWQSVVHTVKDGTTACGMSVSVKTPAKQLVAHKANWQPTKGKVTCKRCISRTAN